MLIYALVAGVLFGLYFSLVGIGLNLVFGVMRIVNLAHGDFLMLGAFVAFGVVGARRHRSAVRGAAGVRDLRAGRACCSIGCWCRGCRARSIPEMLSIILFFGLSQVIEAVTTIFFGTSERSIQSRPLGTRVLDHQGQVVRRQAGRRRSDPDLRPGLSRALGDRGRHQPDRDRAGLCLSVPHAARHADPRGDVAARRGVRDRHRRRSRLGGRLRHRPRACGGRRRVRALHVRHR